jgi:hypothetical protein
MNKYTDEEQLTPLGILLYRIEAHRKEMWESFHLPQRLVGSCGEDEELKQIKLEFSFKEVECKVNNLIAELQDSIIADFKE